MLTSSDITGSSGLEDTYQRDLDDTAAALEADVTMLSPSAAVRVIDLWYDTLKNAERDDLHLIANLLDELREELQSDRLDGGSIGDLLLRLGTQTTAVAADADDARLSPKLERLGTLLTRAGTALGAESVEADQPVVSDETASEDGQDPADSDPSADRAS